MPWGQQPIEKGAVKGSNGKKSANGKAAGRERGKVKK
jgi:hypothetical protein